ncbi:MAG: DUF1573 domain-containing protein [Bacteroidales bacterium]|jgi:hypothetical protein|nr:DUF1573 domain-containing protein [Bacteroidales bacterium]
MKKGILLMIACMTMIAAVNAQKADTTVVFTKLEHDFGSIVQSDGAQSYTFEFTNKGKEPVSIQRVATSCGCTTSGWSKEPIAPGGKGLIKATYSPTGATTFNKSLTVYFSGGSPDFIVLRLRGKVTAQTADKK